VPSPARHATRPHAKGTTTPGGACHPSSQARLPVPANLNEKQAPSLDAITQETHSSTGTARSHTHCLIWLLGLNNRGPMLPASRQGRRGWARPRQEPGSGSRPGLRREFPTPLAAQVGLILMLVCRSVGPAFPRAEERAFYDRTGQCQIQHTALLEGRAEFPRAPAASLWEQTGGVLENVPDPSRARPGTIFFL
jgi:hypothetical protein